MASNINSNNIDGAYPIAGQDNSTQGFRTNFTNIKNNLLIAGTEITDLQNKVIVKSALTGITLDNDMDGTLFSNAYIKGSRDVIVEPTPATATYTLDFADGHVHVIDTADVAGAVTLAFDNWPDPGYAEIKVIVTVANVAHTIEFPSEVSIASDITFKGIDTSGPIIVTFPATGDYTMVFSSIDVGTNVTLESISLPQEPDTFEYPISINSNQIISVSTTATSLTTHSTLYVSGAGPAAFTSTLAAGTAGQLKVLGFKTDGGADVEVTVTNAAWGGTGKITFSDAGEGVTLQYIDSKWYCIGNNGAVFS